MASALRYSIFTSAATVALLYAANPAAAQSCVNGTGGDVTLQTGTLCLDNTATVGNVTVTADAQALAQWSTYTTTNAVIGNDSGSGNVSINSVTLAAGTTLNIGSQYFILSGEDPNIATPSANRATIGTVTIAGTLTTGLMAIYSGPNSTITTVNNSGTISGRITAAITGVIGTVSNSGSIGTVSADSGRIDTVANFSGGTITTLSAATFPNQGVGSFGSIQNDGVITSASLGANTTTTTLTNSSTGRFNTLTISGAVTTLNNSGTIQSLSVGLTGAITTLNFDSAVASNIMNSGTISTLNNSGALTIINKLPTNYTALISGAGTGQYAKLTVAGTGTNTTTFSLANSSVLATGTRYENVLTGVASSRFASGTPSGVLNGLQWRLVADNGGVANTWDLAVGTDYTIDNRNLTTVEINNSQVLASGFVGGLANDAGSITRLINSGTINGGVDNGTGTIGALTNSGVIDGNGGTGIAGVYNAFGGTITTLTNTATGTISQTFTGVGNRGAIGDISNAGTMSGLFAAIENHRGAITTLTNDGALNGGVVNLGSIGAVTNNGSIDATNGRSNRNSSVNNTGGGSIMTFVNGATGVIAGSAFGLLNDASSTITTLTNRGAITGGTAGVSNAGSIGTFNNATNVTYTGVLPTNYNVIINSNTVGGYGQLVATNVTGVTNFSVDVSSTVAMGTYLGVLGGLTSANLGANSLTGQVNGNSWTLKDVNADNVWDLVFGPDYTIDNRNLATVEIANSQTVNSGNIAGLGNTNGSIVRLINNGTILGGVDNHGGQIDSLQNSGTIDGRAAGQNNISGVDNSGGAMRGLVNTAQGQILGAAYGVDNGTYNGPISRIQTLDNAGRIEGMFAGVNNAGSSIDDFTNSGIVAGGVGNSGGTILRLINSGAITSSTNGSGVDNGGGVIDILTNTATGTITGSNYGVMTGAPGSQITLLTNRGVIAGGLAGVNNMHGRIVTFDNATPVTFTGTLPENYNIIVNSNTVGGYGQLVAAGQGVIGALRFGVHNSSVLASGSYLGVLQGLTANNIDASTMTGLIGTTVTWSLLDANNDNNWDLVVTLLPYGNNNSSQTTGTIANTGTIQSGAFAGLGNFNGVINNLLNGGTIFGGVDNRQGQITSFLNNGMIDASGQTGSNRSGVSNGGGTISSLHNGVGGFISGADYGIFNGMDNPFLGGGAVNTPPPVAGLITELTNLGGITGGIAGVNNVGGVIVTFNNATPVTYVGALPTNYNVIVTSNTAGGYGQLIATGAGVTGVTRFGVGAGSTLAVGSYVGVLQGVTSANIDATTRAGVYDRFRWALVDENADNIWDLAVRRRGPDVANTIAAMRRNASGINQVVNQRSANLANALDYDCAVFDKNGICVSIGGRYTGVGSKNDVGVLGVAAYRLTQQLRVGAFIDQTIAESKPTTIGITSTTPMLGAFMVYEQNADTSGLRLRGAFAWQQSKLSANREILVETEGGRGSAKLDSYAFAAEASYGFPMSKDWVLAPYVGLRRSIVERQAYNERSVEGVEFPIAYDTYGQYLTTAYGGLRMSGRLSQQLSALVGVGVEYDVTSKTNLYSGSSAIPEFEAFALATAPSRNRTRAVGSAALRYDLGENRVVSLAASLRQSPYGSNPAFSASLRFTAGF